MDIFKKNFLVVLVFTQLVVLSSCSDDDANGENGNGNGGEMMEEVPENVWQGDRITFSKAEDSDWTLEQNQDRITDNVWITRADTKGLFNIKSETSYSKETSPVDTEWAYGTTDEISSLTFKVWKDAIDNPLQAINKDMVVHLITDDIYIDIKLITWSIGREGEEGAFSYERSTPNK